MSNNQIAVMAQRLNMDEKDLGDIVRKTIMPDSKRVTVSNEQFVSFMAVANEYKLNPLVKEIYAFPSQNGIVPIVGVDGWSNLINSNKHFDGMEFNESEKMITIGQSKPCPEWIECVIYRDDRTHPTAIKEFLDEGHKATAPWNSHTKRMLRHKAMMQCARMAFSLSGIYDEEEAHDILSNEMKQINPLPEKKIPNPNSLPVSQSRTEELVQTVEAPKKSHKADKKEAKTTDVSKKESKKLTAAVKSRLITDIDACESVEDLNDLVPELSEYEEDSPYLILIRKTWKDKKATFK